jgi:hypothetical protein
MYMNRPYLSEFPREIKTSRAGYKDFDYRVKDIDRIDSFYDIVSSCILVYLY